MGQAPAALAVPWRVRQQGTVPRMAKNRWKLDRGAHGEAGADGNAPAQPDDANYQSVGAKLRTRREERGEDLRHVAQMLRIRYPYLKAIEDGRPDELPGPTYAIGFVRTYAEHLGLDSDRLVQRFKAEAAGLHARADLHFPAPLREGKIPSAGVLLVAVILAATIYGGWICISASDQQVAEIVPQLHNRISEIIKGKPAGPPVGVSPVPSAAREPAPEPSAPAAVPEAPSPVLESRSAAIDAAPPPAPPEAAQAPAAAVEPPANPAPAAVPQSAAGTDTDSEVPPAPSDATDQTAALPDAPPAQTLPQTPPQPEADGSRPPPKVYGAENENARIVIHAAADSWVEIRDSRTDELLLTRVLFKGDSYRVPDRAGLTLLTGNAGGLRISVDGQDIATLGPLGAVRRNVMLEPGALKSGTGVGDGASGRTEGQPSGPYTPQ